MPGMESTIGRLQAQARRCRDAAVAATDQEAKDALLGIVSDIEILVPIILESGACDARLSRAADGPRDVTQPAS